jgi:hypothetical protein
MIKNKELATVKDCRQALRAVCKASNDSGTYFVIGNMAYKKGTYLCKISRTAPILIHQTRSNYEMLEFLTMPGLDLRTFKNNGFFEIADLQLDSVAIQHLFQKAIDHGMTFLQLAESMVGIAPPTKIAINKIVDKLKAYRGKE